MAEQIAPHYENLVKIINSLSSLYVPVSYYYMYLVASPHLSDFGAINPITFQGRGSVRSEPVSVPL